MRLQQGFVSTRLITHAGEDKTALASSVRDIDREAWATTSSLRLSAAFRHYSQACLRRREWVPEALGLTYMADSEYCF